MKMIETVETVKNNHKSLERLENINNLLKDSDINSLNPFDFITFEKLLRKLKGSYFRSQASFDTYKKMIIACVKDGDCEPIRIRVNGLGEYIIIDGKARLLAHKLLGIDPVIHLEN